MPLHLWYMYIFYYVSKCILVDMFCPSLHDCDVRQFTYKHLHLLLIISSTITEVITAVYSRAVGAGDVWGNG